MNTIQLRDETIVFMNNMCELMSKFDYQAQAKKTLNWSRQLSESHYNVAFMGRIKVGKSTLLNALLEEEIFPVGPVPLTPAITKLARNEDATRVIWTEKEKESQVLLDEREIPAKDVHTLLVERFNALNQKYAKELKIELSDTAAVAEHTEELPIVTVDVHYPLGSNMEGVILVDTPGSGDLSKQRVDVLLDFIPRADAAVVVLNATQPINKEEGEFIRKDLWDQGIRQLFFVINRFDQLNTDHDRQETFEHVRAMLRTQLGEEPRLYAISGYLAMRGAQWRDEKIDWAEVTKQDRVLRTYDNYEEILAESSIQHFRDDLWQFLDDTGRIAFQIQDIVGKVFLEIQLLQKEVELTEKLLNGKFALDAEENLFVNVNEKDEIIDAVQVVRELGVRAKEASRALKAIEDGKVAVEKSIKLKKRHLQELPSLYSNLERDEKYNEILENLFSIIDSHKIKELVGTEKEKGLLDREAKKELGHYLHYLNEDVKNFSGTAIQDVVYIAEEYLDIALNNVEISLGRKVPIRKELTFDVSPKEGLGSAALNIVGGTGLILGTFFWFLATLSLPVLAPIYGVWFIVDGFKAPAKKKREKLKEKLTNKLEDLVHKVRADLLEKTESAFSDLEKIILDAMDTKRDEIRKLLQTYEAEGANARKTIEIKTKWLVDFKPELNELERQWQQLKKDVAVLD